MKIGDVIEYKIANYDLYLAEIVQIDPKNEMAILALVPRNSKHGFSELSILEACHRWGFPKPKQNLDRSKLLQHKICPLRPSEVVRITDQRW